jgi:AhpC/TSA family
VSYGGEAGGEDDGRSAEPSQNGDGREQPRRLDPDRAAARAPRREPAPPPAPLIDTRPYQRIIGLFGLLLVVVVAVSFLTTRGVGTAGIPAGKQLVLFAAPLASSTLNGDANLNPPCTEAGHDPGALNVCLLSKRGPLVLAFFVTGSSACERQVSAEQAVARQLPPGSVQFAAVAVRASHRAAAAAVRSHRWTIPVAYDRDGAVGAAYGIEVCPIVELAYRGGVVERRLIGEHWNSAAALIGPVRELAGTP